MENFEGEYFTDELHRKLYATDASVYRELPHSVAIPKTDEDLKRLIQYATNNDLSLMPRTAGTSLAGQVVGNGIVIDFSRYFNKIIQFDKDNRQITVQPGIIRDDLNRELKEHGLFFAPITSTSNRAMIGGMVGNNSSGTNSIKYGTTRDKVISISGYLSDGSFAIFKEIDNQEFEALLKDTTLLGQIYRGFDAILSKESVRNDISKEFPKAAVHRRNTGYALDELLDFNRFGGNSSTFNLAPFLCGSEGTLLLMTEITLQLDVLPEPFYAVMAPHFTSVHESLVATTKVITLHPDACELMDQRILDCTAGNRQQAENRFFIEGHPEAMLMIEFRASTEDALEAKLKECKSVLEKEQLGYHFPVIYGEKSKKIWQLRSAGLGVLANLPGEKKAVACIEDTAVAVADLPDYIEEFTEQLEQFGQQSIYYAHAGAGELHLRPILDLKEKKDRQAFYDITQRVAHLVKKYNGSLSGEHGDGRLRAEFIPIMVGDKVYQLFRDIKYTWDPGNIFNPGKIVDSKSMLEDLRYEEGQITRNFDTKFHWNEGMMLAVEKCNGTGDCRKSALANGGMCPSYHATQEEQHTTRGRANVLREVMTQSTSPNVFDDEELKTVMDLCLSCKACSFECPSNVDMATMKSEFLYQYYKSNRRPIRDYFFANVDRINRVASVFAPLYNYVSQSTLSQKWIGRMIGISSKRTIPKVHFESVKSWYNKKAKKSNRRGRQVAIFVDEFTNRLDTYIGKKGIELLERLGYDIIMPKSGESGRAAISKGFLEKAKKYANANVRAYSDLMTDNIPLIGFEPSAILTFKDEYPRLVDRDLRETAKALSENTWTFDGFIANEIEQGHITSDQFKSGEGKTVLYHEHCHQKSILGRSNAYFALSIIPNLHVQLIDSGCCGMSGSFGYEKEHYQTSRQVFESKLAKRLDQKHNIVVANGTSCRHQIADFADERAQHVIEILYDHLKLTN